MYTNTCKTRSSASVGSSPAVLGIDRIDQVVDIPKSVLACLKAGIFSDAHLENWDEISKQLNGWMGTMIGWVQ